MANIPKDVIFIWAGNHADIPAGWERVTALDGKYPKGSADGVNPNGTGGSATHQHTGTTHSHTDSHTHTISFAASNTLYNTGSTAANNIDSHTHPDLTSGAVVGGGLSEVACTYSAVSNDPPYYSVIFIKPTAPKPSLPNLGVYLYDGSDTKSGHYVCDGSNSTPNLVNKYLKGAATNADAGATGGSTTNIHDLTHTHTVASHTHASATSGAAIGTRRLDGNSGDWGYAVYTHTHTVTISGATTNTISGTPQLTTTETVEPAYRKLLTVQNRTGHGDIRLGMIGMWLGTLSSIPANYVLCDGANGTQDMRGKHLKSTATTGEIGSTGGSNTHTHASQNHTHTSSGTHTHNAPTSIAHEAAEYRNSDKSRGTTTQSVHNLTISQSTSVYSNAATSASSSNNEPEYRTVAFIKLKSLSAGGAFLLNML